MNWPNFAVTNGQQAPVSGPEQAEPSWPVHVALMNAQFTTPAITRYAIYSPISVRIVLLTLENRFALAQAIGPVVMRGGGRILVRDDSAAMSDIGPSSYRSTNAMRRLNQFMNADVRRLMVK